MTYLDSTTIPSSWYCGAFIVRRSARCYSARCHDVRWRTSARYSTSYHLSHFVSKLYKTRAKRSGSNLPARNCIRLLQDLPQDSNEQRWRWCWLVKGKEMGRSRRYTYIYVGQNIKSQELLCPKTKSSVEAEVILWFTPFTDDHAATSKNSQGHTWRTVEGVGPLCLVHLVTDFHIVRVVHYILYHVLQYRITREHRVQLRAVVLFLR